MEDAKKNVALLACCQAMLFANNVTLTSLAAVCCRGLSLVPENAIFMKG